MFAKRGDADGSTKDSGTSRGHVMTAQAATANGVITPPVIAPVTAPESQANVVTAMPRPKGVFVASTIQVVFEVLNILRTLVLTVVHAVSYTHLRAHET